MIVGQLGHYPKASVFDELGLRLKNSTVLANITFKGPFCSFVEYILSQNFDIHNINELIIHTLSSNE